MRFKKKLIESKYEVRQLSFKVVNATIAIKLVRHSILMLY